MGAAGITAVLFAGFANAKGWGPPRGGGIKGEVTAFACGNKTSDEAYVCLTLSCAKGGYGGNVTYAGGINLGDTVTFAAGAKTVTVPLGPIVRSDMGETRQITGNLDAFAALLAETADIRITGSNLPPEWGAFSLTPGYGTFSAKGAKAQLARVNKACGFPAP